MKVGDILVFTKMDGYESQYYTPGKHYRIYKIEKFNSFNLGWIKDDKGEHIYFKEEEAEDSNWRFLGKMRKEKLQKINNI